ncbi:leucyl aminopeptidase [Rhodospirillum sp. A1_3_36]|uniref:leucyl aminopeptidase n=1 Tax=Rhodospirillum sp. A1_3_36 TaxID=3391666 RepID=UPI0039A73E85
MAIDFEMVTLFRAELELCKVKPGETLAVLSEGEIRGDYAQAFLLAARQLGAEALQITVPRMASKDGKFLHGRNALSGNRTAIETLKAADIVIDLMGLLFSPEQEEITATGTRMLLVVEPIEVLRAMFPDTDLRRRVEYGAELMAKAKVLRVTSDAGTDVTYGMGAYPVMTEYGYTDEPGRWDHWPSGFLLSQGGDREVNGRVVLQPGDINATFRRYIHAPIALTIREGWVTDIEGDGLDASLMREYMESFDDPRAFAVSHIGWGLNQNAKRYHLATSRTLDQEIGVHGLAYYGNVLFSLGPNTELGGTNDTACHTDLPMHGASLFLDGLPIVDRGRIVPEVLRA